MRKPKAGPVATFAITSLLLLALGGFILGRSISSDIRERHLASARDAGELISRLGIQTLLTREMLTQGLSRPEVQHLNAVLHTEDLTDVIARVNVWNRDFRVVFSTDPSLVGRRFPDVRELDEPLAGKVISEISSSDVRDETELPREKTLAVYVPIRLATDGLPGGVLELYMPYAPIAAAIHSDTRNLYVMLALGLGVLWLALLPTMVRVSRQLRRQSLENQRLALHDSLTGLPNRSLFNDRVSHALAIARRSGSSVAVLLMDLDRFKEINDTLGHASGDEMLREVGPRIKEALRESDTVSRLGGDEFAVLLPHVEGPEAAAAVARRVLQKLQLPFTLDRLSVEVEASIGVALYPDHGEDGAALLRFADIAMYVAKRSHTGVAVYADEHDRMTRSRLTLVRDLRHAIDKEQLVLHYQPKADLQTGEVHGVEALVRWRHPNRGLLLPEDFIPLAENTGMIKPLALFVIESSLAQCRRWREAGLDLSVAVNLSARNLHDVNLPNDVARLLDSVGVPASCLELEITESSIMADPARALEVANRLRELGVRLAIDDFGTGYSSLSYLRQLPVAVVKIDKSFVTDLEHNAGDLTIVRSTIDLARNLGMTVVAEGVETAETWDRLARLGCDGAQGYFLCRPIPADDLATWMGGIRPPGASGTFAAANDRNDEQATV